jgi:hypothetical protein
MLLCVRRLQSLSRSDSDSVATVEHSERIIRGAMADAMKLHYSLPCPNGHGIPIPCPTLSGIHPSLLGTTMVEKKAILACPECGLVSVYRESQIHAVVSPTQDQFESHECHLVFLQIECDDKTCDTPTTVHTVIGSDRGIWKQKVAPKDWQFSSDCRCEKGHPLAPNWEEDRFAWEKRKSLF